MLPASDGVITLRRFAIGDRQRIIDERDEESARWLGPGSPDPSPTACIEVDDDLVGWIDADPSPGWLLPREANVGYSVFPARRGSGYATRAVRNRPRHEDDPRRLRQRPLRLARRLRPPQPRGACTTPPRARPTARARSRRSRPPPRRRCSRRLRRRRSGPGRPSARSPLRAALTSPSSTSTSTTTPSVTPPRRGSPPRRSPTTRPPRAPSASGSRPKRPQPSRPLPKPSKPPTPLPRRRPRRKPPRRSGWRSSRPSASASSASPAQQQQKQFQQLEQQQPVSR